MRKGGIADYDHFSAPILPSVSFHCNMAHHPVTRMVRLLSSAHGTHEAVRTGKTSLGDVVRRTVFSQEHFPKFLAFTMFSSGFAGYFYMESLQERRIKRAEDMQLAWEQNQKLNANQAMLNAMIEDPLSSTWKENLENMSDAQDHFMFGSNGAPQRLIKRITKRLTSHKDAIMRMRYLEPQSSEPQ